MINFGQAHTVGVNGGAGAQRGGGHPRAGRTHVGAHAEHRLGGAERPACPSVGEQKAFSPLSRKGQDVSACNCRWDSAIVPRRSSNVKYDPASNSFDASSQEYGGESANTAAAAGAMIVSRAGKGDRGNPAAAIQPCTRRKASARAAVTSPASTTVGEPEPVAWRPAKSTPAGLDQQKSPQCAAAGCVQEASPTTGSASDACALGSPEVQQPAGSVAAQRRSAANPEFNVDAASQGISEAPARAPAKKAAVAAVCRSPAIGGSHHTVGESATRARTAQAPAEASAQAAAPGAAPVRHTFKRKTRAASAAPPAKRSAAQSASPAAAAAAAPAATHAAAQRQLQRPPPYSPKPQAWRPVPVAAAQARPQRQLQTLQHAARHGSLSASPSTSSGGGGAAGGGRRQTLDKWLNQPQKASGLRHSIAARTIKCPGQGTPLPAAAAVCHVCTFFAAVPTYTPKYNLDWDV